jgi:glycosyltransferase involved in cell wall biosynthesis
MMVHLSLYEGFCIPVLEAMCQGVPVIASNMGSIPEVVADAGVLVDPYDISQTVKSIENLYFNSEAKDGLVKKGMDRIKAFSWEKAASKTLDCYREALDIK